MVSATPSGGWLQSNPVVPELGFPLGTRLQMSWLDEGLPELPHPGPPPPHDPHARRSRCATACPSWRSARPAATSRTSGSCTSSCAVVHGGLDLQGAIDAPNWHNDASPAPSTRAACGRAASRRGPAAARRWSTSCARRGHDVGGRPWSRGRVCAVARDPDGVLSAAANPRGMQGYAVGR